MANTFAGSILALTPEAVALAAHYMRAKVVSVRYAETLTMSRWPSFTRWT
jgi:hypothetical protein